LPRGRNKGINLLNLMKKKKFLAKLYKWETSIQFGMWKYFKIIYVRSTMVFLEWKKWINIIKFYFIKMILKKYFILDLKNYTSKYWKIEIMNYLAKVAIVNLV
jgi:hypothetical protein